jgi:uncharacterized protein DUF4128
MQSYTKVQTALGVQLLTATGMSGPTAALFIDENTPNYLTSQPSSSDKLYVRATLLPSPADVSTLGASGYVRMNGLYAIDVLGPLDKGYTATKTLADNIIAAFVRGTDLTTSDGEKVTIENSFMSPNVTQGAWRMAGFYAVQIQVRWFSFVLP